MQESRYNVWVERERHHYVYNGVSGALLRLSSADRAAVRMLLGETDEHAGGVTASPRLLTDLVRGRMLIADDFDELELLAQRYQGRRNDTRTLGLTIVTSLGCNFDCPYCYEAKHPSIINPDVEAAIVELVDDRLPTLERLTVTWFGGEPLVGLRPLLSLSEAFQERCARADVEYAAGIITNGSLLDERTCQLLRERGVDRAQVTIDGPPDVHDRSRPLAGGGGTFWQVVRNLGHAADYLSISVRVNLYRGNVDRVEELLQILVAEGLRGRLGVFPAQVVAVDGGAAPPSAAFGGGCFSLGEFAQAELAFTELVARYGFGEPGVPRPINVPCTAVKSGDLVIGSEGELYKCWESVGNPREVIGNVRDYRDVNGRLRKWLRYDPFSDPECRSCVALPVCMGGCASHAMDLLQRENRCGTFRTTHREQILQFVESRERQSVIPFIPAGAGASGRNDG